MVNNKYAEYEQKVNPFVMEYLKNNIEDKEKEYRILEIGCNTGYNLKGIKDIFPNCYTMGIDILNLSKEIDSIVMDKFYCLDIETANLSVFIDEKFDFILLLDTLEHLTNPAEVLSKVKNILSKDGEIIITVPNLMHYSIIRNLIENGNFTYHSTGLLDSDHKHLLTFNEIERMLIENSFSIKESYTITEEKISEESINFIDKILKLSNCPDWQFKTFEYFMVANIDNQ